MGNVSDYATLWMRIDGSGGTVAFNSLQSQALKGMADWKEYAITLPNTAAGTGKTAESEPRTGSWMPTAESDHFNPKDNLMKQPM